MTFSSAKTPKHSETATARPAASGGIVGAPAAADPETNAEAIAARAAANLAYLFRKLARLYTGNETSSLSRVEADQLARSLEFTLGLQHGNEDDAMRTLAAADPDELFPTKQRELARRVDATLETWEQIIILMPSIRNVALRDTLASIGKLKARYDTYFASHEVPCSIDYQLHRPIDPTLEGLDYIEAYLAQLLVETRWIAQFTTESCIDVLEHVCPDYRGLHVNLCDLLEPNENKLRRRE